MHTVLRTIFWIVVVAYAIALALFLIGTFGWFGQPSDPLSGVFLIPLGFPWFLLADLAGEPAKPWIAALAPLVNIAILRWLVNRTAPRAVNEGI